LARPEHELRRDRRPSPHRRIHVATEGDIGLTGSERSSAAATTTRAHALAGF
jgi:hypothetical protein